MDNLKEITPEGVEKLVNSEWFELIVKGSSSLILDFKCKEIPVTLALHKYGENYNAIMDKNSKGYESFVPTL